MMTNESAVLGLLADLYRQATTQAARIGELEQRIADLTDRDTEPTEAAPSC